MLYMHCVFNYKNLTVFFSCIKEDNYIFYSFQTCNSIADSKTPSNYASMLTSSVDFYQYTEQSVFI